MFRQKGFTVTELLIAVGVIGVMSAIIAPTFGAMMTARENAYRTKHEYNNQLIGESLLRYAEKYDPLGRLPLPYSQNGYANAIHNPSGVSHQDVVLREILHSSGINYSEINHDGTPSQKLRVYQLVQGLAIEIPLYFQSGPQVRLNYDFGAIYQTSCPLSETPCNTGESGVPGDSSVLTLNNFGNWNTDGKDGRAHIVSSLPVQKKMLEFTVKKLDTVRDALRDYYKSKQSINNMTNWFPNQLGVAAAGVKFGVNAATNQGCRDGWYDLSEESVLVLRAVGLAPQEYGQTAWGGAVEYCRDYDPSGLNSSGAAPHYAAIRLLSDVSRGDGPDPIAEDQNIILTF